QAAARHGQQPSFRNIGHAIVRPPLQRRTESIGKRILGRSDVVCTCGEKGQQARARIARHRLDSKTREPFHLLLRLLSAATKTRASSDSVIHSFLSSGGSVIQPFITRPPLCIRSARFDSSNSATRVGGSFSSRRRLRVKAA